ncbi:hypothetical protein ACLMJK_003327 [Lecanora helva]
MYIFLLVVLLSFQVFALSLAATPLLPYVALSQLLIDQKANNSSNSSQSLPLVEVPSNVPENPILSPPSLNTSHTSNEDHEADEYTVPGTSISLSIGYWPSPSRDLDPSVLSRSLATLQRQLVTHLQAHGDAPLAAYNDDPYRWTTQGLYFVAHSTPVRSEEGQELTYRALLETLVGLYDVMVIAQKPWGAYVMIEHKELGLLGHAVVLPKLSD